MNTVAAAIWDIEELIAMQFTYVRALAEEAAGKHVQDVVMMVLAFYVQFERDTIVDVVKLVGLRLLMLANNGVAVAVNYTMTWQFSADEPEQHIFYDAGLAKKYAAVHGHWHLSCHSVGRQDKCTFSCTTPELSSGVISPHKH